MSTDLTAMADEELLRVLFKLVASRNPDVFNCLPDLHAWKYFKGALFSPFVGERIVIFFRATPWEESFRIELTAGVMKRPKGGNVGELFKLIKTRFVFAYDAEKSGVAAQ